MVVLHARMTSTVSGIISMPKERPWVTWQRRDAKETVLSEVPHLMQTMCRLWLPLWKAQTALCMIPSGTGVQACLQMCHMRF